MRAGELALALVVLLGLAGCVSGTLTPFARPAVTHKAPPAKTAAGLACVMDGICK